MARVEKDGHALNESIRGHVDKLTVEKKEFEIFDQRLRVLQASVGEAEGRMESLAAKDKNVTQLNQRVDALAKRYQELFTQSDELNKKQEALESLHTRLEQVDELSKRTNSQLVALNQSRRDLETLKKEIVDFHKSYAEAAQLRDKLGSDRAALEGFIERVTLLSARTPEIEAKMDAIQAKFGLIEEGTQKADARGRAGERARRAAEPRGGTPAVRRAGRRTHQRPQRRAGRCRAQARRSARAPRRARHHQDADRHAWARSSETHRASSTASTRCSTSCCR